MIILTYNIFKYVGVQHKCIDLIIYDIKKNISCYMNSIENISYDNKYHSHGLSCKCLNSYLHPNYFKSLSNKQRINCADMYHKDVYMHLIYDSTHFFMFTCNLTMFTCNINILLSGIYSTLSK